VPRPRLGLIGRLTPRDWRHARAIRRSGLFDATYYGACHADVTGAGVPPLLHYLAAGSHEGRKPNPLFDPAYYRASNPDVVASGTEPLLHYLRAGASEGRNPHLLFDTNHVRSAQRGFVGAGVNPLVAYLRAWTPDAPAPNRFGVAPAEVRAWAAIRAASAPAGRPALGFDAAGTPDVSVVVAVHDHLSTTLGCLHALRAARTRTTYELIVIDDGSSDDSRLVLPRVPGIRYSRNERGEGFLRACNRAAASARGGVIVFLNNDTLPTHDWLDALVAPLAADPGLGVVCGKLLFPDGRLQEAGGIVWADGTGWNVGRGRDPNDYRFNYLRPVDYGSGACLAVPRRAWEQLGGFDDRFAPAYYEDTDLAFRARAAGLGVTYQPACEVVHLEGVSSGTDLESGAKRHQAANRPVFVDRWGSVLAGFAPETDPRAGYLDRTRPRQALFLDTLTPTPDRDSGSLDAVALMRMLLDLGFQVTFVPVGDLAHRGRYTLALQQAGIQAVHAPYCDDAERFVEAHGSRFDLVLLSRLATASRMLPVVRRGAPQARVVFDTVDLHGLRLAREADLDGLALTRQAADAVRSRELAVVGAADATLVRSEHEASMLARAAPHARVHVVVTPRDVPGRARPAAGRTGVLFVGGFHHAPNLDAVLWFGREIWPAVAAAVPGTMLTIVGADPPADVEALAGPTVAVAGALPDAELAERLASVRVTVAPLRYGAGTKGKIATSLCHGVPCVATTTAIEGMGLTPWEDVLVADDPPGFVAAIARLHADDAVWLRVSDAGLRLARARFDVAQVRRQVRDVLAALGFAFSGPGQAEAGRP
jgi:GT2 family glycosyltransferase